MIWFSLWFWLSCAFYNRSLKKHIILLSKCTSRLANKGIHIKLVSSDGTDHMLQDHNLGTKSYNSKLAKSRENLRQGIFGIVSVWRDLIEVTIVHSLCTGIDEALRFVLALLIETAYFVFERTQSQPRRHLRSHLAMQRLSSEATTSCPNRDAPALREHDQRAVISFFLME